jgi:hypothetical protein
LPEEFATLRRLLEARMGKQGKREFVQVLRLMEVFRADGVAHRGSNLIGVKSRPIATPSKAEASH